MRIGVLKQRLEMVITKNTILKAGVLLIGFISIFLLNKKIYALEYQLLLGPAVFYFLVGFLFFKFSTIIPKEPVAFFLLLFCAEVLISILGPFLSPNNFPIRTPGILLLSMCSYAVGMILAQPRPILTKILSFYSWVVLLYYIATTLVPTILFHKCSSQISQKFPILSLYKPNSELLDPKGFEGKVVLLDF